jgi:hypothetical protein
MEMTARARKAMLGGIGPLIGGPGPTEALRRLHATVLAAKAQHMRQLQETMATLQARAVHYNDGAARGGALVVRGTYRL